MSLAVPDRTGLVCPAAGEANETGLNMKTGFAQNLTIVSVAHFALVFCLLFVATVPGCRKRARVVIPFTFTVRDALARDEGLPTPVALRDRVVQPVHESAPVPPETADVVPPAPVPPPVARSGISRAAESRVKQTRKTSSKTPTPPARRRNQVRVEDIVSDFNKAVIGSRPGARSQAFVDGRGMGTADADTMYRGILYRAFYDAWVQPAYADAGDSTVTVSVQLLGDGLVTRPVLAKSSGNPVMDASVMQAVRSISRVDGLSTDFVRRHPEIEFGFKVELEGTGP